MRRQAYPSVRRAKAVLLRLGDTAINPLTRDSGSLPSAARSFCPTLSLMLIERTFRHIALICILLGTTLHAQAAEKSLYDRDTAKKVDLSKFSILGPQARRFKYDKRLLHAAEIAAERARSR